MSIVPEDLSYSRDHIWIRLKDEFTGICGITDYKQEILDTIVFVESIEEDIEVNIDEKILTIESALDYFNIISPLSGKIIEVNNTLEMNPDLINSDPYGEGWIFEIYIKNTFEYEDLMDADKYVDYIEMLD